MRALPTIAAAAVGLSFLVPIAAHAQDPGHMVRGPHDTKVLKPPPRAAEVDFVVRAGSKAVTGRVRVLSAGGRRQYDSEPFRLRPGETFRHLDRTLRAETVRVVYRIGVPGGEKKERWFFVERVAEADGAAR